MMSKSPWTIHSSREVYSNPWIRVVEDQVTTPRQTPGIYGHIHMKNKAIGILPVDEHGMTWLVGQYRYTLDAYSWEIPMGGGASNESPQEAAARELREETGLLANRWDCIGRTHTSNSVTDEEGFIFLARDIEQTEAQPDSTELLKVHKLPLDEAIQMVKAGTITDAISMIALLMVKDHLD